MILFPAIDLIGGKVVRLERGDRSRCKVYSDDPVAVARSFAEQGASWVHVVDLSAAFGEDEDACAANSAAIKAICGVDGLSVDVGGGVRSLARIDELAGYGARRIALGTVLVTEPGFAEVAARRLWRAVGGRYCRTRRPGQGERLARRRGRGARRCRGAAYRAGL
ncbi:MAG: HisA/HisF-related TIM barrel protein [Collinsella sp.]